MSQIRLDENTIAPGTPSSGTSILYPKSDGRWYSKDDAGTESALGDVQGPSSATDNAIVRFDGTTGQDLQNSGITIADGASGTLAGTNSGDVTLAGTPDYITISGQVITRGSVDLATDVTGDLPYANLTASGSASKILGRGSASAGDWQEITLGTNLSMSGTTLNVTGSSGAMTLLRAASGTDTSAGATNVDSFATSLGADDSLFILVTLSSATQATTTPKIWDNTDGTLINYCIYAGGGASNATAGARYLEHIWVVPLTSTLTGAFTLGRDSNADTDSWNNPTIAAGWTSGWTLALRHDGVVAGGTLTWAWKVYKIAGS